MKSFGDRDALYSEAFVESLEKLKKYGRFSSPRGQKTLEIDHAVFAIDPRKSLYLSPIRDLNFFFLIAENLWYWSGRNTTEIPSYYVKNYRQFSDDGIHQGAYGPQLLEQIRFVVNTLKADKDSRQAVISLWRPNPSEAKDKPCTISFDFKIRDGKLNMHATMRSNDALWGNNYDMPSFSLLQIAIAGMLQVEPGTLFLTAHSYHVYERHFDLMEELIAEKHSKKKIKEVILPLNKVSSLTCHMKNIERLLGEHYLISNGQNVSDRSEYNEFYGMFSDMLLLHKYKSDSGILRKSLLKLMVEENNPFGIIYHDKYIDKK